MNSPCIVSAVKKPSDFEPERLVEFRFRRGLSQTAAGALVGATQGAWSRWENGKKRPGPVAEMALVKILEGGR